MRKAFFCKSSRPMHFSTQFSLVFKQMIFCLNGKLVLRLRMFQKYHTRNICSIKYARQQMSHTHVEQWKSSSWGSNLDHNIVRQNVKRFCSSEC